MDCAMSEERLAALIEDSTDATPSEVYRMATELRERRRQADD